jgi:hypothetical protein
MTPSGRGAGGRCQPGWQHLATLISEFLGHASRTITLAYTTTDQLKPLEAPAAHLPGAGAKARAVTTAIECVAKPWLEDRKEAILDALWARREVQALVLGC